MKTHRALYRSSKCAKVRYPKKIGIFIVLTLIAIKAKLKKLSTFENECTY